MNVQDLRVFFQILAATSLITQNLGTLPSAAKVLNSGIPSDILLLHSHSLDCSLKPTTMIKLLIVCQKNLLSVK